MTEALDFLRFAAVAVSMAISTGCTIAVTVQVDPFGAVVHPERQTAFDAGFMAAANDQFGYPPAGMSEDCQQEWLKGWGLGMRNR